MKMLVYISCIMMTMGMISAASDDIYPDQLVILQTVSNGKRTEVDSGCKNAITGALFGCLLSNGSMSGLQTLHIPSPEKGESNVEKEVNWVIPLSTTSIPLDQRHLRSNHGIIYLTRTPAGEVLIQKEKRNKIDPEPVYRYRIPRDVATVRLILEMTTGGKYKITRPTVDRSGAIAVAEIQTPPVDPYAMLKDPRQVKMSK